MKLISMLTAVATVALSSAAFAGSPARVQVEQEVEAPKAPVIVPSSWGAGAVGPGAVAAGLLGVVALAAVLSDDDSGSSNTTTTTE